MRRLGKPSYLFGITVAVLVCAAFLSWWFNREGAVAYESVVASVGDIRQEVSVTGKLEASRKRELSFVETGILGTIWVQEGQRVSKGEIVATLHNALIDTELAQAAAALASETARRDEIAAQVRVEDVAVSEAGVVADDTALIRAQESLAGTIRRVATLADDALKTGIDPLYEQIESGNPSFGTTIYSGSTKYVIRGTSEDRVVLSRNRVLADAYLASLQNAALSAQERSTVDRAIRDTTEALAFLESFAERVHQVVTNLTPDSTTDATVYNTYSGDVSTARTTLSSLEKEFRTAVDVYSAAIASRDISQRELMRTQAPAQSETLAVQDAIVAKARAAYDAVVARLGERALVAPVAGVVTAIEGDEGELVTTAKPVATLVGDGAFEVTIYIPEADIAKVVVGNTARIRLDAYDEQVLTGTVTMIAASDTVIDGVPTYKSTIALDATDIPLRTGLTADVDIETDARESVVYVPLRAVVRTDTRTYVRIVAPDGALTERDVVLGLRGSDGRIEIVSGLTEGEEVVLFIEQSNES
jgi:HlyD family secretion protein